MPSSPRLWSSLAPSTRKRYSGQGITPRQYNAIQRQGVKGRGKLKAARGHATTPERPSRATSRPDLYQPYLRKNAAKNPELAPYVEPEPRSNGIEQATGSPLSLTENRNEVVVATIYPKSGRLVIERLDLTTNETTKETLRFDPAEFPTIIKHLRALQYIVQVESEQGRHLTGRRNAG